MTVIAYGRNVIAADSRALHNNQSRDQNNILSALVCEKIKLLGKGVMAVAVCGPIPNKETWDDIEKVFLSSVVRYELLSIEGDTPLLTEKEIHSLGVNDRFFLVMTKKKTYYLAPNKQSQTENALTPIDNDDFIAYGTGARIAYIGFDHGLTARKVVEYAIEMDATTGAPVVAFDRSQLKDFVEIHPGIDASMKNLKTSILAKRALKKNKEKA